LRYHDPNNWPLLRDALKEMGRADLIGNSKQHLIPTYQPQGTAEGEYKSARKKNSSVAGDSAKRGQGQARSAAGQKHPQKGQVLTQHNGLPPRETGEKRPFSGKAKPKAKAHR
jgi:hypothetical protein